MVKKIIIVLTVLLILLTSISSYYIIRFYLHQIYLKEHTYTSRDGLAIFTIKNEEAAVKYAKIILEHKLKRTVDVNNLSAKLKVYGPSMFNEYWEVTLSDEFGKITIYINKHDAEIIGYHALAMT